MKVIVIIPTYNERENIESVTKKVLGLNIPNLHVVIVDDNSPDGTGQIADKLEKKSKKVHVIHRAKKLGLGTAYKSGFKYALGNKYNVLITMDADLSHDPKRIPAMLKALKNHDMVIGSRHMKGGKIIGFNVWRNVLSGTAQFFSRAILGLNTHDSTSGFRAYKRETVKGIKIDSIKSEGYSFLIEAAFRCKEGGYKISEVPIIFRVRRKGKSKVSSDEIVKALVTVWRLKLGK